MIDYLNGLTKNETKKLAYSNQKLKQKWNESKSESESIQDKYLQEMSKKLFGLRDKKAIYGFDPNILIAEYMEAWENNNKDAMFDIFEKVELGFEKITLEQNKNSIKNILKFHNTDIENILNQINSPEEADIVIEALIGTEHITLMPKGYSTVKKLKIKNRNKNNKHKIPATYEKALRRNRHMLEEYLKEMGAGQQRAQKISQILSYL